MRLLKHRMSRFAAAVTVSLAVVLSISFSWRVVGAARAAGTQSSPRAEAQPQGTAPGPGTAATPAKPPTVANPHGDIRIACETCHTAESWTTMRKPSLFDHATTGFPLEGMHVQTACKDCHTSKIFSRVATSCADCHRDVHQGRNGLRCQDCHVPVRWVDRSDAVRRHASTTFPLKGVHALLECTRCHVGQDEAHVSRVSSECASCHATEYAATKNPDHAAAGFSQQCETCHDAGRATWGGVGFDHAKTGFALTGAHRPLVCSTCHTSGQYSGLSPSCYACHRPAYERAQDPNHVAASFSTQCTSCHGTTSWAGASFDHSRTAFALTGAHTSTSCTACHTGGRYAGTPTDCYACHRSNYEGTTNPNHVTAGMPTTCLTCHSTSAWQPANFDHARTSFPLTGAHTSTSCTACHTGGRYAGTPTDCYACHRSNYEGTTNPNHAAASFPTLCTNCHTTTGWQPANWNHDTQYFRIYSGRHNGTWSSCTQCHTNSSNYRDFSCFACHSQANTDGHHREVSGYRYDSAACYSCHRGV